MRRRVGDDVHQEATVTPLHGGSQPPGTAATAQLRGLRTWEVTQRDRPTVEPRPASDHQSGARRRDADEFRAYRCPDGANWLHDGRSALKGGSVNLVLYTALAFLPGAIFAVAAKALERWSRGERRSRGVTGADSQPVGPPIERLVADLRRLGRDYSRIAESDLPRRALRLQSVTSGVRRHPVCVLHRAGDPGPRTSPVRPCPAAGDRGDPRAARPHLVAPSALRSGSRAM